MEFLGLSFSLPTLLAFLLFALIFLKLVKKSPETKNGASSVNPPPGPWKLPLIGNLHQLISTQPHHRLRDLADKYGPLMLLQLGQVQTLVVTSPDVAREVLKTHDVAFASRPQLEQVQILSYNYRDIIFSPYGESWKQLRKICVSQLLTAKRVQSFRYIREEEVSDLANWISSKEGSVVNLTQIVFALMYGVTSRAAFGKKSADAEAFGRVIERATGLVSGFNMADMYPSLPFLQRLTGVRAKVEVLHQESDKIIEKIINEHKQRRAGSGNAKTNDDDDRDDLVDVLLKIQEQGDLEFTLSDDSIRAVIFDIFGAGSETAATTVDWAMAELIKNPKLMKKAQAEVREVFNRKGKFDESGISELTYLKLVIKETLRLHPPAPLLVPKECGETCKINGFDIPAKVKVFINAWALGRDPKYWNEPNSFIPERFLDSPVDYKGANFEYIPFGGGRRICPGMTYGFASMELPFAMFLYHFDWKLPNGMNPESLDMTEAFGVTVRRKQDLCMIPVPYHPSSPA